MRRHHLQLHAAIESSQLDILTPPPPPKKLQETHQQMGKANRTICGVAEEAASVPRNPEKVALRVVPVILQGESGIMIKASAFLGSSGSSYFKEYIFDLLSPDAERRPLRVNVLGAGSIVTDRETVTVCL